MDTDMCPECRKYTELVSDRAAGDLVCSECGLVLAARTVDETSEWRTFSNEAGGNDPERVGGPDNPHLTGGGLGTKIAGVNGSDMPAGVRSWATRAANPDKGLISAFQQITAMVDRGYLTASIKNRAHENYKKVENLKLMRGRSLDVITAACLFIACKQEGKPRTIREIMLIANGVAKTPISKKDIGRAKTFIVKHIEADMGVVNPADYMRRFSSHLFMGQEETRASIDVVKNIDNIAVIASRAPLSKAAAAIYMISQLSTKKLHPRDIGAHTGVAEATIRSTYKDLRPHANKLVPEWYAKGKNFDDLPAT